MKYLGPKIPIVTSSSLDLGKEFTPPTEVNPIIIDEATDPVETALKDYRSSEVEEIERILGQCNILHINTLSGSGMSEFIVPSIKDSYLTEGYVPTPDQWATHNTQH